MRIRSGAAALAIVLGFVPVAASAQSMPSMMVQTTPHYTISLSIGPVEQMISQSEAMSGATGEVMVSGGASMPSSSMSGSSMESSMGSSPDMAAMMDDQGMPANYHLEVQIASNATGSVVTDMTPPTIRITDKSTGQFRDLPDVMGMYGAQEGVSDFHYGQNVYLPDGSYSVDVMLGSDTAQFHDVMVSGGMPMASMGMSATSGHSASAGMGNMSMNSDVASDGATLAGQPAAVQATFNAIWGTHAAAEWATEHTASLGMH